MIRLNLSWQRYLHGHILISRSMNGFNPSNLSIFGDLVMLFGDQCLKYNSYPRWLVADRAVAWIRVKSLKTDVSVENERFLEPIYVGM